MALAQCQGIAQPLLLVRRLRARGRPGMARYGMPPRRLRLSPAAVVRGHRPAGPCTRAGTILRILRICAAACVCLLPAHRHTQVRALTRSSRFWRRPASSCRTCMRAEASQLCTAAAGSSSLCVSHGTRAQCAIRHAGTLQRARAQEQEPCSPEQYTAHRQRSIAGAEAVHACKHHRDSRTLICTSQSSAPLPGTHLPRSFPWPAACVAAQ
jgi:hypothetical protein